MSEKILIQVDRVTRYFGSRSVLNDVSFQANKGEITGFLGPNGAGKSTLMQIMTGVLAASSGNVFISGYDILTQATLAKRQLGYLPEQPPLYTDCTVDEYLGYCARLRNISSLDIADRLTTSKEKCGLNETGKRLISQLSKGYQQRLGLAQAILHSPPILILDEPSSGLDPNQMNEMRELIKGLREDHCVILSSHILAEIQGICDRVLIINNGNIVLDKPIGLLTDPNTSEDIVVAGFSNSSISLDALKALPGIYEVTQTGPCRFRIKGDKNILAGSLTMAATSNGWGLNELGPEKGSLEQIYLQLTKNPGVLKGSEQHDI